MVNMINVLLNNSTAVVIDTTTKIVATVDTNIVKTVADSINVVTAGLKAFFGQFEALKFMGTVAFWGATSTLLLVLQGIKSWFKQLQGIWVVILNIVASFIFSFTWGTCNHWAIWQNIVSGGLVALAASGLYDFLKKIGLIKA